MPEIIPNWHPVFVHFTIALLSVATLLFVAGKITKNETLTKAAYINLWLGGLITFGTVAMGFYAYNTVGHDAASHAAMTDHKNWALPTAISFMVLAIWSVISYKKQSQVSCLFVALMVLASCSLAVTGFKGSEAVYRYGLGVMSIPEISKDGGHDSHDHKKAPSHHGHGSVPEHHGEEKH